MIEVSAEARLNVALRLLCDATAYAHDVHAQPADFAVPIQDLRAIGVTSIDCRWLLHKGLVEVVNAAPVSAPSEAAPNPRLPDDVRLLLTPAGSDCAARICKPLLGVPPGISPRSAVHEFATTASGEILWNDELRELSVRTALAKRFAVPARNQETVLSAFQKNGWAPRINNPLTADGGRGAAQKLRDTIRSLNRNQVQALIRFHADGSGRGVRYELL